MQAEKQESWNLIVSAKSKNFNFKLKATKISPTWKIHRFSVLFELRKFLLRWKLNSAVSSRVPRRRRSLKSKILAAVEKFPRRRGRKQSVTAKETPKLTNPDMKIKSPMNRLTHLAFGILMFLFQSIYEKDQGLILLVWSVVLLYFLTLIRKNTTAKSRTVLAFLVISVATAACLAVFGLKKFLNYDLGCLLHSLFGSHEDV